MGPGRDTPLRMAESVLRGKVAIVTGAGSPIGTGHAMAVALVRAGARVALLDLNPEWLAQSLRQIEEIGGSGCAVAIATDVSDAAAVKQAVGRTLAELGGLHVLINNAGTTPRAGGFTTGSRNFWEVPVAAWDRVIAVNFSGAFYMAREVAGHLLAQASGRIIGVTTSMDTMYRKRASPYGPSKAGHEALVAVMAQELDGTGVTANVLVPGGPTNTNFFAADANVDRATLIQPEVMQAPAVWLASDASQACNGRRIIAYHWDQRLPLEERLARASAPAAWPQLGQQAIVPPP
jgi:NAD(P)-dependent dehydrogenase (short-subunit alcohol dehydrogenase family)